MSVIYFLLLVGVLVVIHELGHFVAAKLLDVKVLRFSIGYGRPLVRLKLRETEYQIGIIPIGGYVRILGIETPNEANPEDRPRTPPEDVGRSFESRPLWQRLVIVFAGPAANLILPVIIYFVFFAGHTALRAGVIGDVLENGAAARAGLEPGDLILEIDGDSIRYWEEIEDAVRASPGKELHLRVSRNGRVFERYLTPLEETVHSRDGNTVRQGRVGITHSPFIPLVGVIDGDSPAARAGLRTGDLIISVHGQPVRNWGDVQRSFGKVPRRTSLAYFRGTEVPGIPQIQLLSPGFADLVPETKVGATLERSTYTGLEHAEMFVAHVDGGSPADNAGLKQGDLIVALDDKPVVHWMDLDQRLQAAPTKPFKLSWKRAVKGKPQLLSAEVTQVQRSQLDAYDHTVTRLVFGAHNDVDRGHGATVPIEGRFGYALTKALERTGETISIMASGFSQILRGDTPGEALGGPLRIYRMTSASGNQGWDSFLLMLALISVNLGLLNLLPIPMLDGGHLLVFVIEGARRKPLSTKARERIQLVGLILIVLITLLAAGNDIVRFFS
ncbi:MAG: site-2 protease family protein [Deltaproteobacteria bacterium]|nr:site-2 protease family protein [Deltaproteobacteria bacterium]